jgi:hypothetical protein
VSSVPTNADEKLAPGRIVATIVLALLALVCFGETGRYLLAQHHHVVRIMGSFLLGVAAAIGAWFALRYQSLAAEEAREAERIAAAQAVTEAVALTVTEAAASPGQQATAATQA